MEAINTAFFVILLSAVVQGFLERWTTCSCPLGQEVIGPSKVLLCNIHSSSAMRQRVGNFTPEELDPHLCTHIIYNKADVDEENRDIVPRDPHIDLYDKGGLGLYDRTMKLKEANSQLKVVLQLCCFGGSFWDKETMSSDVIISTFTENAISYLERYGFDGLYVIFQNHPEEPRLFAGLREAFDKRGYLLFTFHYPKGEYGDYAVLTPENTRVFDIIIVGEYWEIDHVKTKIFSPLNSLRKVISDAKQEGLPFEKMVVAIPTFAWAYVLCNASDAGVSAPICYAGDEGETLETRMILIYSEMMYKTRNASEGWVLQRDEESGILYGHSNSLLWTSFEDPVSVRAKVEFALEENLAGVAMMSVDMDDSMGYNDEGVKLPLTRAAHDALRRK